MLNYTCGKNGCTFGKWIKAAHVSKNRASFFSLTECIFSLINVSFISQMDLFLKLKSSEYSYV